MGRLIDEDALIKAFEIHSEAKCSNVWTLQGIKAVIEFLPTAYDLEAVVKKLEEEAKVSREEWQQFDDEGSFGEMMAYEKAIKIVRGEEDEECNTGSS